MKPNNKLTIHEYVLIYISMSAVIAIGMLALQIYNTFFVLAISVIAVGFLAYKLKIKKFNLNFKKDCVLILILILGMFIRQKPHLYIMGGQDQGTYINMARQYTKGGRLFAVDEYRENLDEAQQQIYDRRGSYIMPSFEKWNRPDSEYSMVFYPAHPALLSLTGSIIGINNSVFFLTVTSILTLINIYLITNLLTKNKKSSLIVLVLFALNPVYVFMSKYPVGETTALFFITSGYYFLIKYLKEKENILYLGYSALSFMVFSLTRMTFFIHIPIIILLAVYNKKEKLKLSLYAGLNIFIMIFSYLYYRTFQWPLFDGLYEKTIGKLLANYIPIDVPNIIKIILIFTIIGIVISISFWKKLYKPSEKILPALFSIGSIILALNIRSFTIRNYIRLIKPRANFLERYNIIYNRGFDIIKHVPLFSLSNYVGHLIFISFLILLIYNLVKLGKTKYVLLTAIATYFCFVYLSRMSVMRYDYYNSRYYLTEVIPIILLTTGIFIGDLLNGKSWQKIIGKIFLIITVLYFAVFSIFQIGKYEGNGLNFYNQVLTKVKREDLIIFVNKEIYETKYENNFNDYVAGPLKYYYDRHVLVLREPYEILLLPVQKMIKSHENVHYISNIPLEDVDYYNNEQKVTLNYNHFNNSPGCNYHNYEFLRIDKIDEIPLPDSLKCKLLPNAYYYRSRDYYFGDVVLQSNVENPKVSLKH